MTYTIRSFEEKDLPFLWEMLYQSIFFPEGKQVSSREILKEKSIEKYLKNWDSKQDIALIAIDDSGKSVGAVWMRLFSKENSGYGYIDNDTPEISMAIMPQHRGKGVGKYLLWEIISLARSIGYSKVSLSVDPLNKVALHLYEKIGFEKVYQDSGGSWTMKKEL